MTDEQLRKAKAFKNLHERSGAFVIPNPWDAGSAKILADLGYEALATTSGGLAFSLGRADGAGLVTRTDTLNNAKAILDIVDLPVAADLENGFGDDPESCAETIRLAATIGLVGGSIEDSTGRADDPIYSFEHSLNRVKAAVKAARELPFPFMLTARAENLIHGRIDFKDTMRRIEAFADAGADVLFAPGLNNREEIITAVKTVSPKPLNVIMVRSGILFTVKELEDMGVKRISVGSALYRAAIHAFIQAGEEIRKQGTFTFADDCIAYGKLNTMFL